MAQPPPIRRFERIFSLSCAASRRRSVAPELPPLLHRFYDCLDQSPPDPLAVRGALVALLSFLNSPSGNHRDNRETVSDFVLAENEWERDWSYLPEPLEEVMYDLTCDPPPPDLLQRVNRLSLPTTREPSS